MTRKKIVAGNWKMNLRFQDAERLMDKILMCCHDFVQHTEVILFPPALYAGMLRDKETNGLISIGCQHVYEKPFGAFTGEINAAMLSSSSIRYCLVGHSERRLMFNETDAACLDKCKSLLDEGITPVLCVGESLGARESGNHFEKVALQLRHVTDGLSDEEVRSLMIAYEPVWAIGTGRTATSRQAEEMHVYLRGIVHERLGDYAEETIILYGGSCNEKNADELFACENVDGGLIGAASLKADAFCDIIRIAEDINRTGCAD